MQQRQPQAPQSGAPGGGQSGAYGAPGGYGNGPAYGDRELTAEEQEEEDISATKNEIKFMKQQDVSSTRNALRLAQQAEETGRDTLARLGAQGERIHKYVQTTILHVHSSHSPAPSATLTSHPHRTASPRRRPAS